MSSSSQDVSDMIREHVLPRLNDLETELQKLRRVTWPVCQRALEVNQLDKIHEKKKFLDGLDEDEIKLLLKLKAQGRLTLIDDEFLLVTKPKVP